LNPVLDYDATFLNPRVDWAKKTFNKKGFKFLEENGYILLDGEYKLDAKLVAEFQLLKPYEVLQNIKCPVLTIHGDRDSLVPYLVSKKYGKPNQYSRFITIEKAEHGFVNWNDDEGVSKKSMENQKEVTQLLIKWIEK
jgi:pimeloyl-ACP methyl ester carboxylesterase